MKRFELYRLIIQDIREEMNELSSRLVINQLHFGNKEQTEMLREFKALVSEKEFLERMVHQDGKNQTQA